jgi:hypothetical protein
MRKHIAKALQAWSQAIRTAIDRYNAAAAAITPPRPALEWNHIIEHGLLAEFDLLRDTRQDIRTKPWASAAGRFAMDLYFKIQRAKEEIDRINVEIRRFITYIRDEDLFLRTKEAEIQVFDEVLAHQIYLYRMARGRFSVSHMCRLREISRLPGFTGTLEPGISVTCPSTTRPPDDPSSVPPAMGAPIPQAAHPEDDNLTQELEEEADELALADLREAFCHIMSISTD